MTATLRQHRPITYHPMPDAVDGRRAVDARLARHLGKNEATVHDWIQGEDSRFRDVERLIDGLIAIGARTTAARKCDGILRRLSSAPRPSLTNALLIAAADATAAVVAAQARFQAERTHESAIALGRTLARREHVDRDLCCAVQEWQSA